MVLIALAICLLWEPVYNVVTKRELTFTATYFYNNWSRTDAVVLADLHKNDLVVYEIGHIDGWIDVWIENEKGEAVTRVSTSGKTELVIPKQGNYVLRAEGDHANASITLSIYIDK